MHAYSSQDDLVGFCCLFVCFEKEKDSKSKTCFSHLWELKPESLDIGIVRETYICFSLQNLNDLPKESEK